MRFSQHLMRSSLSPDPLEIYSKELDLLNELQRYEEAVMTCDRIIELTPNSIEARTKKLDLLEKLQRYERCVEICDQIIRIDHTYADAYYRKGKALEKLEHGKRLNPYRARLTSISQNYKRALEAYITASELSPDNVLYREGIGNLLQHFGKINQAEREYSKAKKLAKKYPAWIDNIDSTLWLFYILPISINTILLWIFSSTTQQTLWNIPGLLLLFGEFIISTGFYFRLRFKDQKYHLYDASILFFPISAFAIVWVIAGCLIGLPILPTVLIFLLIGFSVNAFLFFTLDIYESKTIILTYEMMVKVLRTLMFSLLSVLRAGIIRFQEQRKLEQSRVKIGLPQKFNKDTPISKAGKEMNTFSRTKSRTAGNNTSGYDKDGYNKHGFNRDGYDRSGYNKHGFNRDGYDRSGYNKHGFNRDGYDRSGYNKQGFNRQGYDMNGYNRSGRNKDGYDRQGYNRSGRDRNGYDRRGYDRSGRDRDGYDRQGYNRSGRDRNGRKKPGPRFF